MNMTSIKDIDGDVVTFEPQTWAGFNIETNHCLRSFRNEQGPSVALAVLDACGYGKSAAARQLRNLTSNLTTNATPGSLKDAREAADTVVDARVVDDPADTAKKALAILNEAGVVLHDPDDTPYDSSQRTGSMGDLNVAAFHLDRYVSQAGFLAKVAAKEAADREKLEAEAYEFYRTSCEATDTVPAPDWATAKSLTRHVGPDFLAIARAARAMHGVTK